MNSNHRSGQVALITGGARGIGLETARGLGRLGIGVVLTGRDPNRGATAANSLRAEGINAEYFGGDLTDSEHRQACVSYFERHHGKLDILVNNAGVWLDSESASHTTPNRTSSLPAEVLRATFEANFFAPVLLTQLLLPLILKAQAGRIVNVSAELGSLSLHADPSSIVYGLKPFAYASSKTALNAFTVHLAHELRDTPVKVNSVHPGWVRTAMGGSKAPLDVVEGSRTSVHFATLPWNGPTGGYFRADEAIPW